MQWSSETYKRYYKKLLIFYDQFLLPTSEKTFVRSSKYCLVDELVNFEQINWAQSVIDLIHFASKNVVNGKSIFVACAPVLETNVCDKIK
jgi:hypothetical protein